MANVNEFVLVSSYVWSMVLFFAGIFLVIVWGDYLWRKHEPARRAKNQRRVDSLKKLCAMERRVGYRRA